MSFGDGDQRKEKPLPCAIISQSVAELYKKPNLKPKSYESLCHVIKRIVTALGDLPIGDVTAENIQKFFNAMGANRMRDLCKAYLGQVFAKALATGKIKSNPMLAVEIVQHTAQKRSALTPERQERFIAAIAGTPHGLLARLLLATGLRIGEALALTAADIDAERFTVTVSKDIAHLEDGSVLIQTPKSRAAYRTVPISRELCAELLALPRQGRLFPITYNAVRLAFQRVSGKLGYTVTPHILRHTYATRLEEGGHPAEDQTVPHGAREPSHDAGHLHRHAGALCCERFRPRAQRFYFVKEGDFYTNFYTKFARKGEKAVEKAKK